MYPNSLQCSKQQHQKNPQLQWGALLWGHSSFCDFKWVLESPPWITPPYIQPLKNRFCFKLCKFYIRQILVNLISSVSLYAWKNVNTELVYFSHSSERNFYHIIFVLFLYSTFIDFWRFLSLKNLLNYEENSALLLSSHYLLILRGKVKFFTPPMYISPFCVSE